jgi:hypothetical protein
MSAVKPERSASQRMKIGERHGMLAAQTSRRIRLCPRKKESKSDRPSARVMNYGAGFALKKLARVLSPRSRLDLVIGPVGESKVRLAVDKECGGDRLDPDSLERNVFFGPTSPDGTSRNSVRLEEKLDDGEPHAVLSRSRETVSCSNRPLSWRRMMFTRQFSSSCSG